jgi:hemoglobin
MLRKISFLMVALSIMAAGAGIALPASAQEGARVSDATTFKAFGEKAGLVKIMDDFMVGLLKDTRTKSFFENADQARVKEQLVEQICEMLQGPCKYAGGKMKPIHANLSINREHFNALVEQLQFAMDKNNVPFTAQNKLLAVLAPMHRDIITQ